MSSVTMAHGSHWQGTCGWQSPCGSIIPCVAFQRRSKSPNTWLMLVISRALWKQTKISVEEGKQGVTFHLGFHMAPWQEQIFLMSTTWGLDKLRVKPQTMPADLLDIFLTVLLHKLIPSPTWVSGGLTLIGFPSSPLVGLPGKREDSGTTKAEYPQYS